MAAYNIIAADEHGTEEVFLVIQAGSLGEANFAADCEQALLLMLDRKFVRVQLANDAD